MLCWVVCFFLSFRSRLIESYDVLFADTGETNTISGIANFNSKYGWLGQIYFLCQYDIRRVEDITKLNMHQCLTMLTFMKEKNDLEVKQIKSKYK